MDELEFSSTIATNNVAPPGNESYDSVTPAGRHAGHAIEGRRTLNIRGECGGRSLQLAPGLETRLRPGWQPMVAQPTCGRLGRWVAQSAKTFNDLLCSASANFIMLQRNDGSAVTGCLPSLNWSCDQPSYLAGAVTRFRAFVPGVFFFVRMPKSIGTAGNRIITGSQVLYSTVQRYVQRFTH